MKLWLCYGVCVFVFGAGLLQAEALRTWVRQADGREIQAHLISYDEKLGKVTLKMANGSTAVVDAAILGAADQAFLRDHAAKIAAEVEASKVGRIESFVPEGGGDHKVHIYKPPGYRDGDDANKTRPVAFLYDPGGNSMNIVNRLKPAADELGWVLVGIDAYSNTKSLEDKYKERMANTKVAFAAASQRVSFDPTKIVFGGFSGGGWWSYQSASELTSTAAGVLSFGGWMGDMYDKRYSRRMGVAMINGEDDKGANGRVEKDGDFLKGRASCTVKVFSFPGGHRLPPPDTVMEAARWLHKTKKF